MPTAIVTGSGGLIGSESVEHFVEAGYDVIGLENDMRARFFGPAASTSHTTERLQATLGDCVPLARDRHPRRRRGRPACSPSTPPALELVIHTAAQPSHDWAAPDPQTDFAVNANGTLNLLEAARATLPTATFIFCSTNKVYGDLPNCLPLVEHGDRLELPADHRYYSGIDTRCRSTIHALAVRRLQGGGRPAGAGVRPLLRDADGVLPRRLPHRPESRRPQLHGFLSYLMRCTITGDPYTIFGYGGKQVRDNIHSADLVAAFEAFHQAPRAGAVYNIGGGRGATARCSRRSTCASEIAGRELNWSCPTRTGSAITAGGSPTWSPSAATTRTGSITLRHRVTSCRRSTSRTSSCG